MTGAVKKILFVILMLLLPISSAFSQGVEWGVNAGLNVYYPGKHAEFDLLPGFYAGGFAEFPIDETFGVQGELLYATFREGWQGGTSKSRGHRDYIVLPVMGKVYLSKRFSFDFGPQFGILLVDEVNGYSSERARKFDFSFGAGLSCKIGRRFDLSTRYNWGITRMAKNADRWNNTFRLGAGFRF